MAEVRNEPIYLFQEAVMKVYALEGKEPKKEAYVRLPIDLGGAFKMHMLGVELQRWCWSSMADDLQLSLEIEFTMGKHTRSDRLHETVKGFFRGAWTTYDDAKERAVKRAIQQGLMRAKVCSNCCRLGGHVRSTVDWCDDCLAAKWIWQKPIVVGPHKQSECAICLEAFLSTDRVVEINCGHDHSYHYPCILNVKPAKCPMCKGPFTKVTSGRFGTEFIDDSDSDFEN